ncbi:glutamine amidotransferase-related protein [Xylophilus sp. ASV27]|uniref:glutamine amidotransferase-related protein n=1 Tax=Xylophilus sp. ASV27 TaxID=2795129 RepID=UPI0018ED9E85|nr:glutamine amidotransferase [Xylophilus sp. ASV27]
MSQRLLILQHSPLDGPGSLAPYFQARGWQIDVVEAAHADLARIDPLAADLVLPLGSALSVYDEALFPFIGVERALLARRLAAGRAVLGICFGAQLIASALGCRVYRAPQAEVGWYPLELTAEGAASPLRHLAPGLAPAVMHWHQDTFDLPPRTQRLARSALCENQAFALGTHLLALQFHPEVTRDGVEAWLAEASFTPDTRAARIAEIREGAARWQAAMQRQIARCLDDWLPAAGL